MPPRDKAVSLSSSQRGRQNFGDHDVVHIIDDDRNFRLAMAGQLEFVGIEVQLYRSAEQFLANYQPRPVECVLLDLRMPGMHGLELLDRLHERYQKIQVIVVSAFGKTRDVVRAIRNGAADFLEKPVEDEVLRSTVAAALSKSRQQANARRRRDQTLWKLSDREREVLKLFVAAKSTIEIAHQLGISPKTVEKHRLHIFEKTKVGSIPELMRLVLDTK